MENSTEERKPMTEKQKKHTEHFSQVLSRMVLIMQTLIHMSSVGMIQMVLVLFKISTCD